MKKINFDQKMKMIDLPENLSQCRILFDNRRLDECICQIKIIITDIINNPGRYEVEFEMSNSFFELKGYKIYWSDGMNRFYD